MNAQNSIPSPKTFKITHDQKMERPSSMVPKSQGNNTLCCSDQVFSQEVVVVGAGGKFGTRTWCWLVCLWWRLLASRPCTF